MIWNTTSSICQHYQVQSSSKLLYIYATHSAVSEAIVVEKEINQKDKIVKQQILVYFVSEALMGSNKFNSKMEKIYYVVIMSSWKLRHYFEAQNQGPNQSATEWYFRQ
jgi:hypothetical protein